MLSNDIAGRGRPILNTYIGMLTLAINVVLNLVWIPKYAITGSAWASTVSYSAQRVSSLFLYCRLSGDHCHWTKVLLPQRGDWALYWRMGLALGQWAREKMRAMVRTVVS